MRKELGEKLVQTDCCSISLDAMSDGCKDMEFNFQDWVFRFGGDDSAPIAAPIWFRWAMQLGASIKPQLINNGHLATIIVTVPCDSAIAGAIGYGSCLREVSEKTAEPNVLDMFDQFMAVPPGTIIKCLPQGTENRTQRYQILTERSEELGIAMRKLNGRQKRGIHYMTRRTASRYTFEVAEDSTCGCNKSLTPYIGLSLTQSLLGQLSTYVNWHVSLDSVVLCSPTQGASQLRRETDTISISDLISECEMESDHEADKELDPVRRLTLTDLLAVSQWQLASDRESPIFCHFVNASTTQLCQIPTAASTVIFNGPDAYLRLNSRFPNQTHVVVISRNSDPGKLDRFMNVANSLRESTNRLGHLLPVPPTGIQLACFGDRRPKEKQW